jgi:hypothetical protein
VPSDWDFLVFGDSETLKYLQASKDFYSENIDLLIVTNGDQFISPWPRTDYPEHFKAGHLYSYCEGIIFVPGFEWKFLSETEAEYTEGKTYLNRPKRSKAYRVYP